MRKEEDDMKKLLCLVVLMAFFVAGPAMAQQKQSTPAPKPKLHNTNPNHDPDVARGRNQHRLDYIKKHGLGPKPIGAVRG
jgi:Ni/Co efflux regulator RcnB